MAHDIRPEVSQKNPFWIGKHRFGTQFPVEAFSLLCGAGKLGVRLRLIRCKLLYGVDTAAGKKPRLIGQLFRPDQIFPASVRYPPGRAVLLLRKHS